VKRCDLDHRISYPDGPTCSCNIQPLCRSHHRLKTAGLVSVRLVQPDEDPSTVPGTLEWTTRSGRRYRRAPSIPVPDALWAALPGAAGLPARLAAERHERAATLRGLNDQLREVHARRANAAVDARAAAGLSDGGSENLLPETIVHPPAVLDDDPAPVEPARPLESWAHEPAGLLLGRPALRLTA
jgi:hypothetical protein